MVTTFLTCHGSALRLSGRPEATEQGLRAFSRSLRRFHGFGIDFKFDFFANHQPASFEGLTVSQTVVLAVDFDFGFEADAAVAPGVLDRAAQGEGHSQLFGYAVHRIVADQDGLVASLFDAFTGESDGGKLGDIEEVGAAQVGIAPGNAGIYAFRLDGAIGLLEGAVLQHQCAAEFGELAPDLVDDEVFDGESDLRMSGIDLVGVRRLNAEGQDRGEDGCGQDNGRFHEMLCCF